jgi:hypothetical protein
MSTGIIVGIVVAVIVIGAVVFGVMAVLRRRRLQQRFGPEYDRVVGERDSPPGRPARAAHTQGCRPGRPRLCAGLAPDACREHLGRPLGDDAIPVLL